MDFGDCPRTVRRPARQSYGLGAPAPADVDEGSAGIPRSRFSAAQPGSTWFRVVVGSYRNREISNSRGRRVLRFASRSWRPSISSPGWSRTSSSDGRT